MVGGRGRQHAVVFDARRRQTWSEEAGRGNGSSEEIERLCAPPSPLVSTTTAPRDALNQGRVLIVYAMLFTASESAAQAALVELPRRTRAGGAHTGVGAALHRHITPHRRGHSASHQDVEDAPEHHTLLPLVPLTRSGRHPHLARPLTCSFSWANLLFLFAFHDRFFRFLQRIQISLVQARGGARTAGNSITRVERKGKKSRNTRRHARIHTHTGTRTHRHKT